MYKTILCFSILLTAGGNLPAQQMAGQLVCNIREQKMLKVNINQPVGFKANNLQSFSTLLNQLSSGELAMQFIKPLPTPVRFFLAPASAIAANTVTTQSGWFCRQEWKFEKVTRIPLKVRLGNVDAVDYLEGKRAHH